MTSVRSAQENGQAGIITRPEDSRSDNSATNLSGDSDQDLFIALIVPIGTPVTELRYAIEMESGRYGYAIQHIKLSKLLQDSLPEGCSIPEEPKLSRAEKLMEAGDELCKTEASSHAVLELGLREIEERQKRSKDSARTIWLIDSLKRQGEVDRLRAKHKGHLFTIAAAASSECRKSELEVLARLERPGQSTDQINEFTSRLIRYDLDGSDEHSQDILRTFPLSDLFVDVEKDPRTQIRDFFDLLFGNPIARCPQPDEYGMSLAERTALMSAELGLRVGAVIMRGTNVLSVGWNSHPTSESPPEFDSSRLHMIHLLADTLERLSDGGYLSEGLLKSNTEPKDYEAVRQMIEKLLNGSLKGGSLASLTEFQAPVHAEMNALMGAMESNIDISGATIYVTDYPCHGCAKHLLRLGMRVVYLQPYPKSRAEAMYGTSALRRFEPFIGIHPRHYTCFFSSREDRKDAAGKRIYWGVADCKKAAPKLHS